jgi:hypothetical protein
VTAGQAKTVEFDSLRCRLSRRAACTRDLDNPGDGFTGASVGISRARIAGAGALFAASSRFKRKSSGSARDLPLISFANANDASSILPRVCGRQARTPF